MSASIFHTTRGREKPAEQPHSAILYHDTEAAVSYESYNPQDPRFYLAQDDSHSMCGTRDMIENVCWGRRWVSIFVFALGLFANGTSASWADTVRLGTTISSEDQSAQALIRFFNTGASDDTIDVAISDPTTGAILSTWTSPIVRAGTAVQYPISMIEEAAVTPYKKPLFYVLSATPRFPGFAQSVLYKPSDGTLSNTSACDSGLTGSGTAIPYVHTRLWGASLTSHLVINNTGTTDTTVILGIYNEITGAKLGTYTTASIIKGGALFLDVSAIEAKAKIRTPGGLYHYVIRIESPFTGFVQHLLENMETGLYTDLTNQCQMNPPSGGGSAFTLASTAAIEGGAMPATFTCDGDGATVPLVWSNAPAGTESFALLMTTQPGDGTTKWNWILYDIPGSATRLAMNTSGVGKLGAADDGAGNAYAPPCSQGPGAKTYTYTLYALSAPPTFTVPANQITGARVTEALQSITLATAKLNLAYTRATAKPSSAAAINCALIQASMAGYAAGVGVDCSAADYAHISSTGLPGHTMMNGIAATNLQVPVAQDFKGSNAWRIPLSPAIAPSTTSVVDGPVGIAVNGVPIFNPCKQGGCQSGDTKVLGELDICNGHAGRADDYHYHAAPVCLMADQPLSYWDTHPVGWALDGFAIFGYGDTNDRIASRDDICGGTTKPTPNAPAGYAYHVTEISPYVLSCLRGTPSPDLAGQSAKYSPMRQPPVKPFPVSDMTLSMDQADGYQVLEFTAVNQFTTTETGSDTYVNPQGTYRIRYKAVSGTDLAVLLAQRQNAGKSACWSFQFISLNGTVTQPTISYCR